MIEIDYELKHLMDNVRFWTVFPNYKDTKTDSNSETCLKEAVDKLVRRICDLSYSWNWTSPEFSGMKL